MSEFESMYRAGALDAEIVEREYQPTEIPPHRRLGHRGAHRPALDLASYLVPEKVNLPHAVHRHATTGLGMLKNDELGDCGEAMAIHAVEMFHRDAQTPVPPFTDDDAVNLYSLVAGYDPSRTEPNGFNPTDRGTDNSDLVREWRKVGIACKADGSAHTIAGSLFVDPRNAYLTRLAIWEFVVCFRAYALPMTAQPQTAWDVTDPSLRGEAEPGSWGYHDVPLTSYGPWRVGLITWGQPWTATWAFEASYAVQSFVVVTRDQLNLRGVSPAGIDWTKLTADLAALPPAPF